LRPLKFIISAGALKNNFPDVEILFVGAKGRMEMEKVPAAGYKIEGLWISGLQRRFTIDNLSFPFKVMSSLMKSRRIIRRFKPDAVIGVGGFASGPLLYVAAKRGIPTVIQEQNSYPGITNKLLAKNVDKICVAYEGMEKFFPKEKDILNLEGKKEKALEYFKLSPNKKTVLVIGGSLGAKTINESLLKCLDSLVENNIQLVWQTGKNFSQAAMNVELKYPNKGIVVTDFISKMDYAYALADVVVSRAGASSISELSLVNKAAILIPSPNVAEDHQTKNAMALLNNNAAILVKDKEAREKLKDVLLNLVKDDQKRMELQQNIKGMGFKDAAGTIVAEIVGLIKTEKKVKQ
jgi:UDP-N-acetylglucosamine--N-acetylmuramyl-(pentapeptide) pyrophosphoryl-undecaprenol N-acetylglucosamine transferase